MTGQPLTLKFLFGCTYAKRPLSSDICTYSIGATFALINHNGAQCQAFGPSLSDRRALALSLTRMGVGWVGDWVRFQCRNVIQSAAMAIQIPRIAYAHTHTHPRAQSRNICHFPDFYWNPGVRSPTMFEARLRRQSIQSFCNCKYMCWIYTNSNYGIHNWNCFSFPLIDYTT